MGLEMGSLLRQRQFFTELLTRLANEIASDLMPLQNNRLRAISGAYGATPIRNLEVEIRVLLLGIHLDSIQGRFRVRLE